jgi:ornithine carbamoyltransferase
MVNTQPNKINKPKKLKVIKLGGSTLTNFELMNQHSIDIINLKKSGYDIIVIHGGGPHINKALTEQNIKWEFLNGQRVTTPSMMKIIERVLVEDVNVQLSEHFKKLINENKDNIKAGIFDFHDLIQLNLNQNENNYPLVNAKIKNPNLGLVGEITFVNPHTLLTPLGENKIVLLPSLGFLGDQALNINADIFAAQISSIYGAQELIFITDQEGILSEKKIPYETLTFHQLEELKEMKIVTGGMLVKTEAIMKALENGVKNVKVVKDLNQTGKFTLCQMSRHFLTGTELSAEELSGVIELAHQLKKNFKNPYHVNSEILEPLREQNWCLMFDKPSLRTRLSFSVGINRLGGQVVETLNSSRKEEDPQDLIRVIQSYFQGLITRTFSDDFQEKMSRYSKIPIINALSDLHHPCQILADLMTLEENFSLGANQNQNQNQNQNRPIISYIGDGNNILHSLLILAPQFGYKVHYACPAGYEPNPLIKEKFLNNLNFQEGVHYQGFIGGKSAIKNACQNAVAIYTDVWTSMGFESEKEQRQIDFKDYHLTEEIILSTSPQAYFLHCLPMERGLEVSNTLPQQPNSLIYHQAENRLYVQEALIMTLMSLGNKK